MTDNETAALVEAMAKTMYDINQDLPLSNYIRKADAALAVAKKAIRDDVLEEAACHLYSEVMDIYGSVRRVAAVEIRAMKEQPHD